MGSSKSSGGNSQSTVRFAEYLENAHKDLLNNDGADGATLSVVGCMNTAFGASPYGGYAVPAVDDAFFGDGYKIENFPSLYDMFGRFMGGLDICDLWAYMYENVVHAPEIDNAVSAHAALLDDDIQTKIMPRFLAGMRDINSVMASSFIIGKSIIENARVKSVNDFAGQIRLKAVDASIKVWERHLEWNKSVIASYGEYAKQYYNTREMVDRTKMEFDTKGLLWDLNLFDYGRALLGAMQGGAAATGGGNEPSQVAKSVGGALSGAATGAMVGGPVGAVVGGAIGLAASFF